MALEIKTPAVMTDNRLGMKISVTKMVAEDNRMRRRSASSKRGTLARAGLPPADVTFWPGRQSPCCHSHHMTAGIVLGPSEAKRTRALAFENLLPAVCKRTIGSRNKEGRRERRKRKAGQQRIGHQTPPVIIAINCRQAPSDGIL
ncbi:hypothetical protein, partial [Bradyrhizobium sp.]|uniref:hypothetical protein n=1 Tax=Bradyrhizobium sp. TaxID=376 RepID=UPI002618BD00